MATSLHVTKTSKEAFLASFKKLRNTSSFSVLYSISPFWNIMWRFTGIFTHYSAHSGSARKYGKYEHYISVFYTLRKLHCIPVRNKISLNFSELSAQCRSSPSFTNYSENYSKLHQKTPASDHLEVSCKKGVFKYCERFIEKHQHESLFFNKAADLSPVML